MKIILDSILIFLPAIAANMAPVLAARYHWLPKLVVPINLHLLGSNKTWRGIVVGVLFGSVVGYIQYSFTEYGLMAGGLLGFGALFGDAVKSLIKRQLNIAPGTAWPVWDQIDYVLGAALVSGWLVPMTVAHVLIAVIVLGFGSYLTSLIGVRLGIKQSL